MSDYVEYISYGGGTPSAALLYANCVGLVSPRAEIAVFSDTGSEMPETYEAVKFYAEWAAEFGVELITVEPKRGPLLDTVIDGAEREHGFIPIPAYGDEGRNARACTRTWKVEAVEQYVHDRYGAGMPLSGQIGFTRDLRDIARVKDSMVKRNRLRYPLIDTLRWSRSACVEILQAAGLPVPPPSSCYFCPLHNAPTWQNLKIDHPELYEKSVDIDETIRQRSPLYLDRTRRPLKSVYGGLEVQQSRMDTLWAMEAGEECDGVCDT